MIEWIQQADASVLFFIQEQLRVSWMNRFWECISRLGDYGLFWIILAIILLVFKKTRKVGVTVACALVLATLINNGILKTLIGRARPYEVYEALIPLGTIPIDSSFPSGHTCASFACALIYVRMLPKKYGIPLLVLAILIAWSRLYLCVHFPSDVLGGFLVALFSSTVVYVCALRMEKEKK